MHYVVLKFKDSSSIVIQMNRLPFETLASSCEILGHAHSIEGALVYALTQQEIKFEFITDKIAQFGACVAKYAQIISAIYFKSVIFTGTFPQQARDICIKCRCDTQFIFEDCDRIVNFAALENAASALDAKRKEERERINLN